MSERRVEIADDERRIDPKDAIAGALEGRITARVRSRLIRVIRAVDFDREALSRRKEVSDEATEQRHLPAKDHAQAVAANLRPEQLLGGGL